MAGCFLADGESLWPALFSKEQLLEELLYDLSVGEGATFFAEMMNDREAGTRSGVDVSLIPAYPTQLMDDSILPQGGFYIIDPSLGKKASDDVAIGKILVYDGVPVLRKIWHDKFSPLETVDTPLKDALESRIQLIVAESVAYQATLLFWMDFRAKMLNITGINFCEVTPEGYAKNQRISDMLKLLMQGKILLHPEVRSAVIHQLARWDPLRKNNVDVILDVLAYIMKVMAKFSALMALVNSADFLDFAAAKVLPIEQCCSF